MAQFFWNQPIPNTFRSSIAYFNLSFFFLLLKYKVRTESLIWLVFIYTIIVVLLWFYAIGQAPNIVFGSLGEDDFTELVNNRGGYRIRILGTTLSIICYFYFITKAYLHRKRWMYGVAILLFLFNCTDLTRSNMASIVIATLVLFYLLNRNVLTFMVKTIIAVSITLALIYYFFSENIDILINLTDSQFERGNEDDGFYRLKEYVFFFTEFNKSWLTILFGNGAENNSDLQMYVNQLKLKGYYSDDVSYVIPFLQIGILGLLYYLFLFYKALKTPVQKEYLFAKIYIVYVVFSSLTITTLLDSIPITICMYMIYVNRINKKQNIRNV